MEDLSANTIRDIVSKQRIYFSSGLTKEIKFRIANLKIFRSVIQKYEKKIADALWTDLRKSYQEAFLTEINIVLAEIKIHEKNLGYWAKPKNIETPFVLWPSTSRIIYEPLGVSLILAPWNYPFQLLMNPLVGAISSGCTAVLKPSPYAPTVAQVMQELISETFDPEYISLVQGNRIVNELLLKEHFDFIFFTGSPHIGKVVMKAAAEHLTPMVLELGGKCPCIVDKSANIDVAAKRIAWGKSINAGQTCIAPDYLLVHEEIKDELILKVARNFEKMYGSDFEKSELYPRIINAQAFNRLFELLQRGKIVYGGNTNKDEKFISPTIIDGISADDIIMKEEIFGPILPVVSFVDIDKAIEFVALKEKPLALYYFGNDKNAKEVLNGTSSGGACINDSIMQFANPNLPFGGIGNSGLGKYHGKYSFLAFSNTKSVVKTPVWIDIPFRYPPFKYFKIIKKIV
jgi:aldehyde dehydrogenase (NAD+)